MIASIKDIERCLVDHPVAALSTTTCTRRSTTSKSSKATTAAEQPCPFDRMFSSPDFSNNVSLRLSKVLDEIGVNEETITKRKNTYLLLESISTLSERLRRNNVTIFNFGSQTEGTTTMELKPDTDILVCDNGVNVIQDVREWELGYTNLLMIPDENTPPGYCLLQKMYADCPFPVDYEPQGIFIRDARGRVLMRNTCFTDNLHNINDNLPDGFNIIRNGPSMTTLGSQGFADQDIVHAYHCKSWPADATPWLHRETTGNWPSEEMKELAINDGCFVVPVSSRENPGDVFQWRISTSLTERRLMFSLNITQIRCCVLMKMILKTYPYLQSEDTLSTFICKTVLLTCIENNHEDFWHEHNLLSCLSACLRMLHRSVSLGHCPHFLIPGNNLLSGRISPQAKPIILDILQHVISSEGRALLEIKIDCLGDRLSTQFNSLQRSALNLIHVISGQLLFNFMLSLSARNADILIDLTFKNAERVVNILEQSIHSLADIYYEGHDIIKTACRLFTKFLCTSLGSVQGSSSILTEGTLTQDALSWFSTDLTTGITSRLKLASMFYTAGDIEQTEIILMDIEERFDLLAVQSICGCYQYRPQPNSDFLELSAVYEAETMVDNVAFCIRYLPSEINCIPEELQYELSRSNFDTRQVDCDEWMNWAVVDSIPYFYFLQYKVYRFLGNSVKEQIALENLVISISSDPNLGHPETALNILGQCLEQDDRLDDALKCYTLSSSLYSRNNAANIHTCRVLSKIHCQN